MPNEKVEHVLETVFKDDMSEPESGMVSETEKPAEEEQL